MKLQPVAGVLFTKTPELNVARVDDSRGDAELVAAVTGGDRSACGALVDRHMGAVFGVVLRVVGNKADAEDLTQDTFVRAFEHLDQYGACYSLRNWLLRIGTNLAINHLRTKKRERLRYPRIVETREQVTLDEEDRLDLPSPDQWQHWLEMLDESQRAAIVLFHFQGLSYVQVAEILGVPLNTVRTFLHRGRKRLRDLMSRTPLPETERWNVATLNT